MASARLPDLHVSFGSTNNLASPRIPDVLVSADTPYRGRMLKYVWCKQRLPFIGVQDVMTVDITDIGGKSSTPYRLPRIDAPSPHSRHYEDSYYSARLWGQFGYENIIRIPELGPEIRKHYVNPPKTVAQQYRQANLSVPKFRTAAITPTMKAIPLNKDTDDLDMYQSVLASGPYESEGGDLLIPPGPTPTPVSRTFSPTKSVKSIHWALGSSQHPLFDKKGRGRVQGPYSREFTVTCFAPNNWLKMKLGGGRTSCQS
ncbi:uncharacterized protein LOC126831480 isoform X1 [Patella vulgata]|uniref:uncharacterized protein LOC126831480 isoform X1 n=1 Tax=Patella vulgata TaxID=6465 RepID=UPI00217FC0DA|nr:uncharacterized protein LOC126831480 isoform X1 [Patella vulgata]